VSALAYWKRLKWIKTDESLTAAARHLPDGCARRHAGSSRPVPHRRGTRGQWSVFALLLARPQPSPGFGYL